MWTDDVNEWAHYVEPAGNRVSIACLALGELETRVAAVLDEWNFAQLSRRCADTAELLATCRALHIDVAVLSSQVPGFDRNLVTALQGESVVVIAINDPLDQYSVARLEALGVRHWVAEDQIESQLIARIDFIRNELAATSGSEYSLVQGSANSESKSPSVNRDGNTSADSNATWDKNDRGIDGLNATPSPAEVQRAKSLVSGPKGTAQGVEDAQRRFGSLHGANVQREAQAVGQKRHFWPLWWGSFKSSRGGSGIQTMRTQANGTQAKSHSQRSVDSAQQRRGKVVAIAGPQGAPGRSTIAAAIASEALRLNVLLIDADTVAPCQSQLFGMLEESSGLAFACRAANLGALSRAELLKVCDYVSSDVKLLSGLPRTDRWPEITHASLEQVIQVARDSFDLIVIDIGSSFESEDAARFDSYVPSRNMAARCALENADMTVLVGSPDPVGLKRFIAYVEDFRQEFGHSFSTLAVMNRMGSTALWSKDSQVAQILERFAGITEFVSIPYDRVTVAKAVHQAGSVAELNRSSEVSRCLAQLAQRVAEEVALAENNSRTRLEHSAAF